MYRHSATTASQNGELAEYRESLVLNRECVDFIQRTINSNFMNNRLGGECIHVALDEYGAERVQWVLAHMIQQRDYDMRISANNKEWAKGFDIPFMGGDVSIFTHPLLLNSYIMALREALIEKEKPSGGKQYKYYALRRPVDVGTIPPLPVEIRNYDWRMPVEDGLFNTWGYAVYSMALSDEQTAEYDLRASNMPEPAGESTVLL